MSTRYYNPEVGRFLNADAFTTTGQGLLGHNLFVCCNNCPSNFSDYSGNRPVSELERFGEVSLPVPPRKKTKKQEKKIQYNVPLFKQGNRRTCWAYCQTMERAYTFDYDFTQKQADKYATSLALCVHRGGDWNRGAMPTNAGKMYRVNSAEDLYTLLKYTGPVYALYNDIRPNNDVHSSHMVVVTGVNVTTNTVATNNPWDMKGEQSFEDFLTGVAWDDPYSYDFQLTGVYIAH